MVRPHLEYAQSVWSPFKKKDITIVENVQCRAAKLILGMKDLSYLDRLRKIDLPTLAYRRLQGDMIEVFKIINDRYDKDANIKLRTRENNTRGHQQKLYKERANSKLRQMQFRIRVVDSWNSLPESIVNAPSVKSFERRLDRFWAVQDIRFDHEQKVETTSSRITSDIISEGSDLDIEVT